MAKCPPVGPCRQSAIGSEFLAVPVNFVSVEHHRDQHSQTRRSCAIGVVYLQTLPVPSEACVARMVLLPPGFVDPDGLPVRVVQRWVSPRLIVAQVKPPVLVQRNRAGAWILHLQGLAHARAGERKNSQNQSKIQPQSTAPRT